MMGCLKHGYGQMMAMAGILLYFAIYFLGNDLYLQGRYGILPFVAVVEITF
ncbi:MAG: hypothetical protein K9K75_02480 [Deltaproteobacteria bacterium]|nr:hypothetical protein [Deltaproteobacteria bacterium]